MRDLSLCVITDATLIPERSHARIAEEALAGGAPMIQVREKRPQMRSLLTEARHIREMCTRAGATLILNDRLDLACLVGADGVHLGQDDLPPAVARTLLPRDTLMGVSTHSVEQARRAEADGADYIGVGPIFSTPTKETRYPARGLEMIRAVRKVISLPLIAIGGMTLERAADVIHAGADGVAVISAVVAAPRIRDVVEEFLSVIRAARGGGGTTRGERR